MEGPSSTTTSSPGSSRINIHSSPDAAEISHNVLRSDIESLRHVYGSLQLKHAEAEENLAMLQHQMDECADHNARLSREVAQTTRERDSFRDQVRCLETNLREKEEEYSQKIDVEMGEKEGLKKEMEDFRERVQKLELEREGINSSMIESLESLSSTRDCLSRVLEGLEEENDETSVKESEGIDVKSGLGEESRALLEEVRMVSRLATEVEIRIDKYKESKKKEKRELENSLVSLTEENRDVNKLLRIAILEKESLEKKLKGRVPLLPFGLQKVGFGFMMGANTNEPATESTGANTVTKSTGVNTGTKSDSSECEEEIVSLASTVERIMKNLRLEITQLRKSLEESRSDTERLQCLTEKQAKEIAENKLYIKELEDRERVLAQNVEELSTEIKETEEEVARWKNACELEVEAGKKEIEERDKVVDALKQELQRTKTALDIANGKLRLKEELASAAMTAQAAAERSLQLADNRAIELRQRTEELTRHIEEQEKRERSSRKARRICWPCQFFKFIIGSNTSSTRVETVKRMLPEMHALLN
ncbi:uncharacterized protein At3g49055 isoform X2 [Prosopis cineraria]|uniref:uncharacterized protein At3g49055 isoform X2 n=1 Tax=Prosopis cineraria TaxID=364024 RepID=UPI00241032DB|nr:uncharacterized protein At3g49055 isoform X2 [Prosopis cineraria]